MRACRTPKAMTAASPLNAPINSGARAKIATPIPSASAAEVTIPNRIPLRTRPSWPAPIFWLTKVASAIAKQVTGKKAKPSTLL